MYIHCNHSVENNDLEYHQDIAEEKDEAVDDV